MKKILCLSGGGCRGYSQVQVLKKLEHDCGRPLCEEYDLIVGTSVGAINASIIASGKIPMDKLSEMYESVIRATFKKRGFLKIPKYDRLNFANSWNDIVGLIKFKDVKTKLMITTVDLVTDRNIFYKSWHENIGDEYLLDLILRSFAAPLYFGHIIDNIKKMVYSDGGIGNANLPLNEAKLQAEAFGWYNNGKELEIHAVGTLYDSKTPTFEEVSKDSWVRQLSDFLNPLEGGLARAQSRQDQIQMMEYICSKIPNIKFRYWDSPANGEKLKLDGVEYMVYYRALGALMAQEPLISYN
jgi:predicted acylesterase/phospholipase RssA